MKIWIFIFLLLNLGMGVYVYSKETRPEIVGTRNTDLNANQMRPVPFHIEPTPVKAQAAPLPTAPTPAPIESAASVVTPPTPAVCLEWQHVTRNDLEEAKTLLNTLLKPENISEELTEEPSRYWIFIPANNNTQATVAKLKAAGITDVSVEPSQNISLGVYSVETTAKRHLDEIRAKGFKETKLEARKMQVKEATFFLKDVDKAVENKLNESLKNFSKSALKTVDCNKS